jgi:hypothetical protein
MNTNRNIKQKKCRYCETLFYPIRTTAIVCTWECANLLAKEKSEKKEKKEWNVRKAKMKSDLMTLSDWLKIAQSHFNEYIRLRDKDQLCISCQKPPLKKNAGHYYNANNHYNLRFDERNVHLQCEHCNTFLSGNLINYRENLIKKIGIGEYNVISEIAKETRKFTIEEVKEIAKLYKQKVKILKNS